MRRGAEDDPRVEQLGGGFSDDLVRHELHRLAQIFVHCVHCVVERLGLVAGESELVDRRGARDLDARGTETGGDF